MSRQERTEQVPRKFEVYVCTKCGLEERDRMLRDEKGREYLSLDEWSFITKRHGVAFNNARAHFCPECAAGLEDPHP